jgi:SAM-dependent methyltransferase
MTEQNGWLELIQQNPGHSQWYIDRFRALAQAGTDLAGEARTVDAMLARGSTVLDAGCGAGRIGAVLAAAGHDVVGVDLDPVLIDAARAEHPGSRWLVGDLAELDLPALGVGKPFDAIVCGGNVLTFVAPSSRVEILRRFAAHLHDKGRVVIGFGADRGYDFNEFLADATTAGLTPDLLLSTWDLRPLTEDSDFIVAVLRRVRPPP